LAVERLEDGAWQWTNSKTYPNSWSSEARALQSLTLQQVVTVRDVQKMLLCNQDESGRFTSSNSNSLLSLFDHITACTDSTSQPSDLPQHKLSQVQEMKSHSDALPLRLSLACFQSFDAASISCAPVEPVDRWFGRYGGRCFALRNVLSVGECKYLIQGMSQDMEAVRYRHDYRRNDRCIFDSRSLADLLWSRIKPCAARLAVHVDPDPARQQLLNAEDFVREGEAGDCPRELRMGLGNEGTWHPIGLNECFRFCRYNPGGFFRKHSDGQFRRSEDEMSLFTCMFYLDGDMEGGATRFLRPGGCLGESDAYELAQDSEVLASLAPEPGLCLLFFQPGLLHEGEDIRSGIKHILRTDVMFRRDPDTRPDMEPHVAQALALVQQAEAAEERKDCDYAASLYRRAFKMCPEVERML